MKMKLTAIKNKQKSLMFRVTGNCS